MFAAAIPVREEPRTDDRPDAERHQRPRTERALQAVLAVARLADQQAQRLLRQKAHGIGVSLTESMRRAN